jgi:hypothetical protein
VRVVLTARGGDHCAYPSTIPAGWSLSPRGEDYNPF